MRYLVTILLLFACTAAFAQTIKGVVADAETAKFLYAVSVINLTTKESAYTNERGEFTLQAKSGETLLFNLYGYNTYQEVMPAIFGTKFMRFNMQRLSFQLEEVIVRPGMTKYQEDSTWRRETYARTMARQKTTSFMSPFSLLAEKLNKNSKRIYRFQKSFNYWEGQRFIDSRYSPELVAQQTGLIGDSVAYFMNANPMPYDYARTASDLELKMWIRTAYKQWSKAMADSLQKQQAQPIPQR